MGQSARDISTAIRNLDVGTGIHTQRAQELRGEATSIVENRSAAEVVRGLKARFPGAIQVVEAEAVEVGAEELSERRDD